MIDRGSVDLWLAAYVRAWKSYDPDQIGALFSADVSYRFHPFDDPVVGRDSAIAAWRDEGDFPDAPGRDEPGSYDAVYRTVAVDGDVAVAIGTSTYLDGPGGDPQQAFENCFLLRFDDEGRCREFTEWFMERPRQ